MAIRNRLGLNHVIKPKGLDWLVYEETSAFTCTGVTNYSSKIELSSIQNRSAGRVLINNYQTQLVF
jgi:hypothetical protein